MELHRLDGFETSGIDNVDIQDVDFEIMDDEEITDDQIAALEGLGYVHGPDIVNEILDEDGNVVMYADQDENLYVVDGLGELGFLRKIGRGLRNASRFVRRKVVRPVSRGVKRAARFTGRKVLKPALKTFNRFVNPATILLRNGFLLAMKINLMNVAGRLRYGYLSTTEARRRGASMSGFSRLKSAVSRAEKIYEGAGGKRSNLKRAILTGKGNRDRSVPLSGPELGNPIDLGFTNEFTDPFEQLVIESEPEEIEALLDSEVEMEGLGAVATGSAIAAASGVVASVSALLNKITGVFDKLKKKETRAKTSVRRFLQKRRIPLKLPSPRPNRPVKPVRRANGRIVRRPSRSINPIRIQPKRSFPVIPRNSGVVPSFQRNLRPLPVVSRQSNTTPAIPTVDVGPPEEKPGFFEKNKKALMIGGGLLVVGGGIYFAVSQSKKKKKGRSLEGAPRDKNGRLISKNPKPKKAVNKKLVAKALL